MLEHLLPVIGMVAALMTSLSYVPQVRKALPRGATADLSLKTLGILTTGLAIWVIYGVLKDDLVIILGNGVGAALSGMVLFCKIRDLRASNG
ncbi:SemiSWEET family sugar transporter [Tardiphaga sp.]|uniref:SemiSWEET family sugar transporter n=1 Tax=Tardiphaga sp. TaxID=1926292 RepID=UPI0037DA69FD